MYLGEKEFLKKKFFFDKTETALIQNRIKRVPYQTSDLFINFYKLAPLRISIQPTSRAQMYIGKRRRSHKIFCSFGADGRLSLSLVEAPNSFFGHKYPHPDVRGLTFGIAATEESWGTKNRQFVCKDRPAHLKMAVPLSVKR